LRFEGSYLLQRMTAQRNDLMTPKASDPLRLTPRARRLSSIRNFQYSTTPALLYILPVIPESAGGGYPESSDLKPFWTPASAGVTLSS
jgi:hypothetical protein